MAVCGNATSTMNTHVTARLFFSRGQQSEASTKRSPHSVAQKGPIVVVVIVVVIVVIVVVIPVIVAKVVVSKVTYIVDEF